MKTLKIIGGILIIVLLVALGFGIASYDKGLPKLLSTETEAVSDSVTVPTQELGFTNCIDIVQYHADLVKAYEEDSIFRSMSDEIVTYVSTVLLKENKDDYITVSDIVRCYLGNKAIFDTIKNASDENILQITIADPETVDSLIGDTTEAKTIPKKN